MSNPFFDGNPISPTHFIGRKQEIKRIVSRILTGQSTAIVGESVGKTSLMRYLEAPENQEQLYSSSTERLLFSSIDCKTLIDEKYTEEIFWQKALLPMKTQPVFLDHDASLGIAYLKCRDKMCDFSELENLFATMTKNKWRLVLFLDEFDELVNQPNLNSLGFFSRLRSLAIKNNNPLVLVVASWNELTTMARLLPKPKSSDLLNFIKEINIGCFIDDNATDELFKRADGCFTDEDLNYVRGLVGGHPYLLQVAASILWYSYQEGINDPTLLHKRVKDHVYHKAESLLSKAWGQWSVETQMAFTVIALTQTQLKGYSFDVDQLGKELHNWPGELRSLKNYGYIMEDKTNPTGYRVQVIANLLCLPEILIREIRPETPFSEWLQKEEWLGKFGLIKGDEKKKLESFAQAIGNLLKDGATTLTQAAAKGVGEAIIK